MPKFTLYIIGLIALSLTACPLHAESPIAIKKDHPERYVVKPGDSLIDVANLFLEDGWQWPKVWLGGSHSNDPNLVYPGDVITLNYNEQGKPYLSAAKSTDLKVVKLNPKVRIEELSLPIPTIPLTAIHQFLIHPQIIEANSLNDAPYILSTGRGRLLASNNQKIYIRHSTNRLAHDRYFIVRPGELYKHAETGETLGQEALIVGEVEKLRDGDPATARVLRSNRHIREGDRLMPSDDAEAFTRFYPSIPDAFINCTIIDVHDGINQIGPLDIVVLDCGRDKGLVAGDILTIDKKGETIDDPNYVDPNALDRQIRTRTEWMDGDREYSKVEQWFIPDRNGRVKLPDEPVGALMIFRTFNRLSFGLVMKASDNIYLNDKARTPN
jgi:hypothetical protein